MTRFEKLKQLLQNPPREPESWPVPISKDDLSSLLRLVELENILNIADESNLDIDYDVTILEIKQIITDLNEV